MQLTVVSWNIHSGIGTDGAFDLHRIGEVLREVDPDIAALQEVGDFRGITPDEHHPEQLAEALGMHMAYGPNVILNGRRYGNAILTRLPILKSKNYDLSVKKREPRGALRCDLGLEEGRQLHIFCLHLGLSISERRAQETLLLSADILRDATRSDPVLVCGDFNYWVSRTVSVLVRHAIHDAALMLRSPARTYHSKFPIVRLDRIYVDEQVRPLEIWPHRTKLAVLASDHLPLVLRLEAPLPARPSVAPPVQLIG